MQSPHRHACVGSLCRFQDTAERYPPKAWKPDVVPLWSSIAGTANAEEGLVTSQQINSKTSITRSAAECKLLTWCRCPFGWWLFLCRRKNFQNRLFKTRFSVGLNRRTFWESRWRVRSKYFVNFCEKGSKKCVLAAYHMGGLFRETKKCKWSVNFHKRVSKNRVPVAYAVKGFFRGHTAQNAKFCRIK